MSNSADLEMQTPAPVKSLPECRQRLQHLVLEGIPKLNCEHIDFPPILHSFERIMETWPKDAFLPGLATLNITAHSVTLSALYDYFYEVATILSRDTIENVSIDHIWKCVLEEQSLSPAPIQTPEIILSLQHLTLASLGIFTMLFSWLPPSSDHQLSVSVATTKDNIRKNQTLRNAVVRVTGAVIRNFDCLPRGVPETADQSNLLYLSSLNLSSLVNVGMVHIEWTDQLGSHLLFDPSLRTLKLFKFPSFCAIIAQKSRFATLFENVLDGHNEVNDDEINDSKNSNTETTIQQEVLLSYRLILGQTPKSRRLFLRAFFPLIPLNERDGLLRKLGSSRNSQVLKTLPSCYWPKALIGGNGRLKEQDVYNTWTDFPLLGKRLLILQTWNTRQQPSTFREIWRDRRSPGAWLAFWAVLIFGGVSTILSALQLAIAAAQFAISLPPSHQNDIAQRNSISK